MHSVRATRRGTKHRCLLKAELDLVEQVGCRLVVLLEAALVEQEGCRLVAPLVVVHSMAVQAASVASLHR
jgi:hypothetical protein